MKTLTEKYNAVLEGKFNKKQFVRDARLAHPQLITQYNGYEDTVAILKNKGYIFEQIEKYKEEKLPAYDNGVTEADKHPLEAIERGVDYELEKKGFNTIQPDFSEEDYEKVKKKVIDNLEKNPNHYLNILADEPTRVQKNRKDVMKPVEKDNHVDKDNGMVKANLKESVNEGKLNEVSFEEIKSLWVSYKVIVEWGIPLLIISTTLAALGVAYFVKLVRQGKNAFMAKYREIKGTVDKKEVKKAEELINKVKKKNESVNEGRRAKSKGGKVVKEDDYGNGGYVEMMSADLNRGINLIQKAWDDWKAGPLTEPAMIEHAKDDLIRHIQEELTFFDEEDTVMETDLEEPLQEKKEQLKESFKKLIVKVLTEQTDESNTINGHKVELVDVVNDQNEYTESYAVFLIDDEFLIVFAVVVGSDVPGANIKDGRYEAAVKYYFPGELVIGMKDGLEKYAKGPTSRAKMTAKRIFGELAQQAVNNLDVPNYLSLDPSDFEYGSLDTIFESTVEEKDSKQGFTLDGKVV